MFITKKNKMKYKSKFFTKYKKYIKKIIVGLFFEKNPIQTNTLESKFPKKM